MPLPTPAGRLRAAVARAEPKLREWSDADAGLAPAPGKWCPKEILGHLVDSAVHNHRRFVLARDRDDLVFDGYDQEASVRAQRFNDQPWSELIDVWVALNRHIARLMEATPVDERDRPRVRHSLDRVAWEIVPVDEPATLGYFMLDYVGHLQHHLRQIDPALADPPAAQRGGEHKTR